MRHQAGRVERYAAYGDAVCAMNVHAVVNSPTRFSPRCETSPGGVRLGHGARGGARSTRVRAGVWGVDATARAGEPPETLSFSDLVRAARGDDAADLDGAARQLCHREGARGGAIRAEGGGGGREASRRGNARAVGARIGRRRLVEGRPAAPVEG